MSQKLEPKPGMKVVLIDPKSDPVNARFLEKTLIPHLGSGELEVNDVARYGPECSVSLKKDGQVVMSRVTPHLPMRLSWYWLQPVEVKADVKMEDTDHYRMQLL